MPDTRLDLLRWQFDLTWSLLEYHLDRLEPADLLWEPAAHTWTVHRDADGTWRPDWADTEPDPIPLPTIGWVTWHIGWWWSVALDHLNGKPPRDRTEIVWPGDGDGVVRWLREQRAEWLAALDGMTVERLAADAPEPWPTAAHLVGWVNAELMKNVAEVGQLRLLRAAGG